MVDIANPCDKFQTFDGAVSEQGTVNRLGIHAGVAQASRQRVRCKGYWLPVGVSVVDLNSWPISHPARSFPAHTPGVSRAGRRSA
jgi:hypothetical protein